MTTAAWRAAALALSVMAPVAASAEPAVSPCATFVAQQNAPLHWAEGLTVVTEVANPAGRYQTVKKIVSYSASAGMRISYTDGSPISPAAKPIYRFVSGQDLREAKVYDQIFSGREFEQGATALGPSTAVVRALKQNGFAETSVHSLRGDALLAGRFTLQEPQAVDLAVLVNDQNTALPVLHVGASFGDIAGEFWILDDPEMPLTLMYHIASSPTDWQEQRVTAITLPDPTADAVQKRLAQGGCIELQDVYFDFDGDSLKDEARRVLSAIAAELQKHPAWHLTIAGYTDNVGTDAYNLDLSQRRAGSVKRELVARFAIDPARLTAAGHGANHPAASNDTAAGRARNRRVEMFRDPS